MRTCAYGSVLILTSMALLIAARSGAGQSPAKVVSSLETIAVGASEQSPSKIYSVAHNLEAPNWTRDGASLIFDSNGTIYRIPLSGGTPQPVPMGEGMRCNGSHGLSPDGKLLAISCSTAALPGSHVYVLPAIGGAPRLVTEHPASYFHTWSPDGKTIVFTRPENATLNLIAIDVHGGPEIPLTRGAVVSDDPDFSPDGQYVYFCSDRGGNMQIWRMRPDGTMPEQITFDEQANWTPHPSPDGRWIVFLSYAPGTKGHPANQPVKLRLLSLKDHKISTLVSLMGGAGTINVPSWAPDSRHLAFVSYHAEPD